MASLDSIFGSDSGSAIPGGNVTKPLMIALFALLASRYMSGGSKEAPTSGDSLPTAPPSDADASPGDILGGLGGLLRQFQQNGFGDAANSWIGTGPNKPVAPAQISNAVGPEIIDALSRSTGLPKDQIAQVLSQVLPRIVDQLTPQGQLPTQTEMARLMR